MTDGMVRRLHDVIRTPNFVLVIAATAIGVGAVVFFGSSSHGFPAWAQGLFFALLGAVLAGAVTIFNQLLTQTREIPLRLALTGQQEVGKTVFSVLLFDYLMNTQETPEGAETRFTPDARSAIATFKPFVELRRVNGPLQQRRVR